MEAKTCEPPAVKKRPPIGRRTAVAMIFLFAGALAVPPCHQLGVELKRTGRWRFLSLFREAPTHASLKRFEEALARESELAARARLAYQTWLLRWLGQGNDKVLVGRHGFLFFHTEVEMAAGPGFLEPRTAVPRGIADEPAPRPSSDAPDAIVDFERQLRARGIHLVFVPLPVKPFIYPEAVWPGYPAGAGPAWNRDRDAFKTRLAAAGVDVVDVTDDLWRAKAQPGEELFLKLDTHWTPRGLAAVADRLAGHVKSLLPAPARPAFTTRIKSVTNFGDLLRLLDVQPGSGLFPPQTVEIVQVLDGGAPAQGDDASEVLLLGDSFTNVYRRQELEWGQGAGLGEQLMLRLGRAVQVIAVNGGGATAVRETLARRPAALARKKVVLWACSARDLFDQSVTWERVPLPDEGP
jgi:hypothetical protein